MIIKVPSSDAHTSLSRRRKAMRCTKMHAILTLGEAGFSTLISYRDDTSTTNIQKAIIDSWEDWYRTSEDFMFIAHVLGWNDEQMDTLFDDAALLVI
jgi:hypothetical protein